MMLKYKYLCYIPSQLFALQLNDNVHSYKGGTNQKKINPLYLSLSIHLYFTLLKYNLYGNT